MRLLFQTRACFRKFSKPVSVSVRAIVHADHSQILLVQHTYIAGLYLPGGGVEQGESARDAIVRELEEEVGLREVDIASTQIVGIFLNEFGGASDHIVLFEVKTELQRLKEICESIADEGFEIASAELAKVNDLPESLASGSRRRVLGWAEGQSNTLCGRW